MPHSSWSPPNWTKSTGASLRDLKGTIRFSFRGFAPVCDLTYTASRKRRSDSVRTADSLKHFGIWEVPRHEVYGSTLSGAQSHLTYSRCSGRDGKARRKTSGPRA